MLGFHVVLLFHNIVNTPKFKSMTSFMDSPLQLKIWINFTNIQDEEEDESPNCSLTITSVSKAFPILQSLIKTNGLSEEDEISERSKSPVQNIDLNDFLSLEMRAESGDEDRIEEDNSPSKRWSILLSNL